MKYKFNIHPSCISLCFNNFFGKLFPDSIYLVRRKRETSLDPGKKLQIKRILRTGLYGDRG